MLYSPSADFMKNPPGRFTDDEAGPMTEKFISGIRAS
jgi:hypothetical protein